MTAMDIAEPGKLEIGRVIQQTFAVVGRNFSTFFILALIFVGLPSLVAGTLQFGQTTPGMPRFNGAQLATTFISLITTNILQGALVYGAVQDLNGRRASVSEALSVGLRAFLPLIGLGILMTIGLGVGFVLLIVPGVMLACAWCVAAPSLVAERLGVIASFSRSAALTRGNRWRVFALFLVLLAIWMGLGLAFGIVLAVAGFGGALAGGGSTFAAVTIVLSAGMSALVSMIAAAGAAVLYVELRRIREGQGPQWLVDVFS